MRTIRGVVLSKSGQMAQVRLESGLTVGWKGTGMRIGRMVEAMYDFTTNTIASIVPAGSDPNFAELNEEPEVLEIPEAGEEEEIFEEVSPEYQNYLEGVDSGALLLEDDWCWNPDQRDMEEAADV